MSSSTPTIEKYIDQRELLSLIPFSRQHVARLEAADDFPRRINIGLRKIAWRLSDIQTWLEQREALAGAARSAASARGKHAHAGRAAPANTTTI
jgi:prophage regulatory protein